MKLNIRAGWANNCMSMDRTIDVSSYEELFREMDKFFVDAVGCLRVDNFAIEKDYVEGSDEFDGSQLFWWSNRNLKRSQNLSDVWDTVEKEIRNELGEEFFNEN